MIVTHYQLFCDECGQQREGGTIDGIGLRGDAEAIRFKAAQSGWRRLRPKGKDSYGDYCGRCVEAIEETRSKAKVRRP